MPRFDFDAWRDLAERDPAAYFRERERAISGFISERPESEHHLRDLQCRIDQVRAVSGSPAAAARELTRMLGERLEALAGNLKLLDEHTDVLHRLIRRGR